MHFFTHKALLAVALITCPQAFAGTAPEVAWINLFDSNTTAGDNNIAVATAGGNAIYWLNTLGSTDAAPDIFYNGEYLFTGSPYSAGASFANNIALTRTDASGAALWSVYSNSGDYASGDGALAVAADGSVVFVGKVRHTDGCLDRQLALVDAAGNTTSFGTAVERRYYSLVMARVSPEGAIEWLRTVDVAHGASPDGSKDFVADAVSAKAVAIDDEGNIYVGGSFNMPLTFTTADGTATITARNASEWNGSSQSSCSDLFIARFDADGFYTGALKAEGAAMATEKILDLVYADGMLYATGSATAATDAGATLGGKELKAGTSVSPFVAAVSPSLEVKWLGCIGSEPVAGSKSAAWQNAHVTATGGNLWLASMANGVYTSFSDASKSVSTQQGTLREGLLVKFDAATGEWLAAADSRDGFGDTVLGGYLKAIQNPSRTDKVYVYGYLMNSTKGVFFRGYDAETLAADTEEDWYVISGGGAPSALGMAYDPSTARAYVATRGSAVFKTSGALVSETPMKWAVAAARVDLPGEFHTGVENVADGNSASFELTAGRGTLSLSSTEAVSVAVYDLAGRVVAVLSAGEGSSATVNVSPGIYVAAGKKVLVR